MTWLLYTAGLVLGLAGIAITHPGLMLLGIAGIMAAAINEFAA